MGYGDWMNGKIKKCTWVDINFVKLSTAAFILMIAKLWPPLLSLDWYWYALLGVIFAIKPLMVMFSR